MMIQRTFSSGSRQAPDPHDNFLEQFGFYRKHTARDSSSLFRTISEQMYDTQIYHLTIRESCVSYMKKNKLYFQNCLNQYTFDVDINEYLDELSKIKTFGTLLELEAMAHMFARNIILFRPLELGHWFIFRPHFEKYFQVFFISHDRHFDTIFSHNFIEDAAFSQSIVFELLYKHVFKLPDITYAVERMLHASSFEETASTNDGMYCRQIYLKDGRTFELDTPEDTCCILNNYELCHFHNKNFPLMAEVLQNGVNKVDFSYIESKASSNSEFWQLCGNRNNCNNNAYIFSNNDNLGNENDSNSCLNQLTSLLPGKYVSCVRQLLYEGITPFSYKVAKALDPDIYRNVEFDLWSEIRKEQRLKNLNTGRNNLQLVSMSRMRNSEGKVYMLDNYLLQVGVKCQVYLREEDGFYTGYIQEMPETHNGLCVVFIEDLGDKRTVPYDCLKPLPPDQIKPWPLPYRLQKKFEKREQQNQIHSPPKFIKHFANNQTKCKKVELETKDIMQSNPSDQHFNDQDDINLKLKQYCNLNNFTPTTMATPIEISSLLPLLT